jgi:hypothetical protein
MGNEADSDFVPFQINYIQMSESDGTFDPLRIETKSCSEPYDVSIHMFHGCSTPSHVYEWTMNTILSFLIVSYSCA